MLGELFYVGKVSVLGSRAGRRTETAGAKFMLSPLVFNQNNKNKIWQKLQRYWPWLLVLFFVLLIFCLLAPYLFRPWVRYPEKLRAEIAWRYFRASFQNSCREDCLAQRQAYAAIWRPFFQANPELAASKFQTVFTSSESDLQAALIKIMAADYGSESLPPLLGTVIADPEASAENKRLIVNFFPQAFTDPFWFKQLQTQASNPSLAEEERVYALRLLTPFSDSDNFVFFKKIVLTLESPVILETAFMALGNWPQGKGAWSQEEILSLADLIPKTGEVVSRARRLWFLSEVGKVHPETLKEILLFLSNNENLDLITRGLAAEALKNNFNIELKLATPTAAEWQEFYEAL